MKILTLVLALSTAYLVTAYASQPGRSADNSLPIQQIKYSHGSLDHQPSSFVYVISDRYFRPGQGEEEHGFRHHQHRTQQHENVRSEHNRHRHYKFQNPLQAQIQQQENQPMPSQYQQYGEQPERAYSHHRSEENRYEQRVRPNYRIRRESPELAAPQMPMRAEGYRHENSRDKSHRDKQYVGSPQQQLRQEQHTRTNPAYQLWQERHDSSNPQYQLQ